MLRSDSGTAAVEFGLIAPLFIVLMVGLLEFGYYLHQADTLEKSLRAGAMYAARSDLTSSQTAFPTATETEIENVIKTGNKEGTGDPVLAGWNGCSGCLIITIINRNVSLNGNSTSVNVIQLEATVPYDPVVSGALSLIGFDDLRIQFRHEQVHLST